MKNHNDRFTITDSRFLKKTNTCEIQNYIYLKQHGLETVLPEFVIENGYLSLEKCESIYPYFSLTDECFQWLYSSTVGKLHRRKVNYYSLGVYKYMSPQLERNPLMEQRTNSEPYFSHVHAFIKQTESDFHVDISEPSILALRKYIGVELKKWIDWKPNEGFSMLHGDWKISNMVFKGQPLLIDLEHMRLGLPEMEVSNFAIQLFGMRKESDEFIIPFLEELFSCSSITTLNYDLIRTLTIPLLLYLRYLYAQAGRILFKESVLAAYPLAWKRYESMLL